MATLKPLQNLFFKCRNNFTFWNAFIMRLCVCLVKLFQQFHRPQPLAKITACILSKLFWNSRKTRNGRLPLLLGHIPFCGMNRIYSAPCTRINKNTINSIFQNNAGRNSALLGYFGAKPDLFVHIIYVSQGIKRIAPLLYPKICASFSAIFISNIYRVTQKFCGF